MTERGPGGRESKAAPPGEVAVIGIGCRFPGATCLEEFWDVLVKGENHITEVPPDRWTKEVFYDKDPDAVGKSYTMRAGFIKDFADFDHKLFGINESEASQMDLQQRHVLECTYMALENAGITKQQIDGEKIGVYIGSMNSDYNMRMVHYPEVIDQYSVSGIAASVIANRVSYLFNLTGPSMTIDTACSSSIVAIHQAILGMRAGDCSLAICGGVSLILHPQVFTPLCKAQMLSKTGQCHAFSNDADGYTRGEGCGIVILKLAEKASSDGDNIWGTIVTGLNQDGHFAQPITAPSEKQQEELLKDVFTTYHIDPGSVQYIEAHGTGTRRGDPVEVGAFSSFFAKSGQQRQRYIGSVKTNIGHLEPAAGVAGLIKVLLMMKHNTIVPSLHFNKPNEDIDFERCQFVVPTKCYPWVENEKVACLNSFGFGGANSHAVIRNVHCMRKDMSAKSDTPSIVCFSGSTFKGLKTSMMDFIAHSDDVGLKSLAFTSTLGRAHFRFRKSFVACTVENLKLQIEKFLSDHEGTELNPVEKSDVVFVFCGMGTAWKGMCKDLMEIHGIFTRTIRSIDKSLKRFVAWSLTQRFQASDDVNDPIFGPIAIFACQVALARLWESWGIIPDTVVGQSVGEVAAAHIAGILPLDEAVRVVYQRTSILSMATGGQMFMIRNMDTKEVEKLSGNSQGINVALYYSPISCTVSGDCGSVEALKDKIQSASSENSNVQIINLNVTSAFHSHHMNSCQQKLNAALVDLKTEKAAIKIISTVDPEGDSTAMMSADYWGKNVRHPVRFHDAIKAATNGERKTFVEIGPKPVLRAHLKDIFTGDIQPLSTPSLSENEKGGDLLKSVALLYENKVNIKWEALVDQQTSLSPVPRYSFDKKKLWKFDVMTQDNILGTNTGHVGHLFVHKTDSDSLYKCKICIKPSGIATLYEHKVHEIIVVPGATYAETGFALVKLLSLGNPHTSTISVEFSSPVTLKKGIQTELDVNVVHKSSYETTFSVIKGNTLHAHGTITSSKELHGEDRIDLQAIKQRCSQHVSGQDVYKMLGQSGFTYGENFATISNAMRGEGESLAALKFSPQLQKEMDQTLLHPAVLDAMLQSPAIIYFHNDEFLPVELSEVTLRYPLQKEMFVYSKLTHVSRLQTSFFLCLLAPDGMVLARVRKFSTKMTANQSFDEKSATYQKEWVVIRCDDKKHDYLNEKAAVFTNLSPRTTDFPWNLHDLDEMAVENIEMFETSFQNIRQFCVILKMPSISLNGDDLLEELIKRITCLRLIVLYHSTRNLQIPVHIIMEARNSADSLGAEAAASCLNEAINGFCRCLLKEFKPLNLKTVEIYATDREDFIERIPEAMNILFSENMKHVPEIRFKDDLPYIFELQSNTTPTPVYRTTPLVDDAVLCSRIQNEVVEPSLLLVKDPHHTKRQDEVELVLTTAVVHNPLLYLVTTQEYPHFGISEAQTYPIFSLEFSGKIKSKSKDQDVIACYPIKIQKTITVPTDCTIKKILFPQYESGYLVILYILWSLCNASDGKSVGILYVKDTEPLAKALAVLLKSRRVKSVSLLTPEETMDKIDHEVLISTVMLMENVVQTLAAKKWNELKTIVFVDSIVTQHTIQSLTWCPWLKVIVLRPLEMFSPAVTSKTVPKMLQWIKTHSKETEEIVPFLKHCLDRNMSEAIKPIYLTEILQTKPLSLESEEESGLKQMKTPNTHLIKKTRSYLVVGGLTGLGWECVSYLAMKGAGYVIILNRRKPNDVRQKEMVHMGKAHGCVVKSFQTDVSNLKTLQRTLLQLQGELKRKPLAGIFFGAAVLCDATLLEMTTDKLKSSLSPKVSGAWNLHILTASLPLDFFVFHSSTAAVLGNAGQSNYGAGNAFLDELAHCRRRGGLSGQSFNWGPLGLGMLQEKPSVAKRLQKQGFNTIEKKEISQCLTHLLMLNEPQSIMMKIDKRKLAEQMLQSEERFLHVRLRTVFEPYMKSLQNMEKADVKKSLSIKKLKMAGQQEALHMLQLYLKNLACNIALLDEDTFDMTGELKQQDIDSMHAIEMSGEIMSDIGSKLSAQEIQLQSAVTLAQLLTEKIFTEESVQVTETNNELIVTKVTILQSIAESFFWFNSQEFTTAFVLVCTVQLPDVAEVNSITRILKSSISLHKLARSTCDLGQSFAMKELTVDEAFDLRVVSGVETSEVDKIKREPITLESQGPVRFIFLTDTKQLVLVFHKFFFDLRAVTVFINDILTSTDSSMQDYDDTQDSDVADEIQKVLAPQFDSLQEFWKSRLAHIPQRRYHVLPLQCEGKDHILITKTLDGEFYRRMISFTQEQKLSFFQYFVSIYQLCVCFMNNTMSSTITTSFDTRSNVPALAKSLGRCTNLVPLVSQLAGVSATTTEFLNRNKMDIEKCLQNGIFPYEEMKKLVTEDTAVTFRRNYFIYEDDTLTSEQNDLTVEQAVVFAPETETYMFVWQKKKTNTIEIKFHLNGTMFNNSRARAMLDATIYLLTETMNNPDVTTSFLKQKLDMHILNEVPAMTRNTNSPRSHLCSLM